MSSLRLFTNLTIGLITLTLVTFGLLKWLQVPTGNFLDWMIGGASFWWLLIIVTVPWNIHFEAKEVLATANQSIEKGIPVEQKQIKYVKMLAQRSLFAAIALHLISTIGLYSLAIAGISKVGYISSGAALLLTILRPAIRGYEYLAQRLAMIRQELKYPREDIIELRDRVSNLEEKVNQIATQLNPEDPTSWIANEQRQLEAIRNDLTRIAATGEQLRITNQAEHEQLTREAKNAIAQLTTDGQFLDHIREIIRFFKQV